MNSSRRKFLTGLAGVGAFATVSAASPLKPIQRKAGDDPLSNLPQFNFVRLHEFTPELFKGLLGSAFQVDDHGTKLTLRLTDVQLAQQPRGVAPNPAMFSLRFQYVKGTALPQGTYQFQHPQLGSFAMFVVPSAKVQKPTYTAIFNRT